MLLLFVVGWFISSGRLDEPVPQIKYECCHFEIYLLSLWCHGCDGTTIKKFIPFTACSFCTFQLEHFTLMNYDFGRLLQFVVNCP